MNCPACSRPLNPVDAVESVVGEHQGIKVKVTICLGCRSFVIQEVKEMPLQGSISPAKGRKSKSDAPERRGALADEAEAPKEVTVPTGKRVVAALPPREIDASQLEAEQRRLLF